MRLVTRLDCVFGYCTLKILVSKSCVVFHYSPQSCSELKRFVQDAQAFISCLEDCGIPW